MKNKFQVTEAELEVLKVIWKKKKTTSKEIVDELLYTTNWKSKTIQTLITRLVDKGALDVDKSSKKGYIYSPNVSEQEYKKVANESFINKLYNGSLNLMLSTFITDNQLSKQDINNLKNLLNEK
ncbi:BlaI/MecI/CopY family transcriptional regulator [Romboutsia weinsteinii]|uniref:BlaI/MecI/CopY family transcriptional regulator n=1 Tax=Romboutsia weinsteinii TaxID=2020949 RepID=A0A371J465_9FIRM|nr:BlaI/MecI/CopY family transcriptional regulator [Romboutsia weinsteinii]RDY27581.1 BlaI/MecI/CopY family transcriptional regulator [Romboutsia weinsteinii]